MNRNRELAGLYLAALEGRRLSATTCRRVRYFLQRFLEWLGEEDLRELTEGKLLEYRGYLSGLRSDSGRPLKIETVDLHLFVLKGWFASLVRSDLLLANPAANLTLDSRRGRAPRATFTEEQMAHFLEAIRPNSPVGRRDRAFFELLYSSGLRFAEAAGLQMKDLNLSERLVRVRGKGSRERTVPFCAPAREAMLTYLKRGRKRLGTRLGDPAQRPFVFLCSTGPVSWKVMRKRLRHYLALAGLAGQGLTMHSIRHATATHLLSRGAAIRYVQELLGHRAISSTEIYTHPSTENIKAVYRSYHPRENEHYREVDAEYLAALDALEAEIRAGKEYQRARLDRWAREGRRTRDKR
jgi:integrase/recombinase XerC